MACLFTEGAIGARRKTKRGKDSKGARTFKTGMKTATLNTVENWPEDTCTT